MRTNRPTLLFTTVAIAIAALAMSGCRIETRYTPRTPGKAALGIRNGEPGIYKGGILTPVSSAAPAVVQCSPAAGATAAQAADHHASYRTNVTMSSLFYALGALMPPMMGFGVYFGIRAAAEQQESRARIVDAINQHNDERVCVAPRDAGRTP